MKLSRLHIVTVVWLCSIGILAAFVHVVQFSLASSLLRNLLGSIHGPGFGIIAVSFLLVFRTWNKPTRAYVLAGLSAMFLGGLTEVLQFVGPRDADLMDLLHDGIGVLGFLGVGALIDKQLRDEIPAFSGLALRISVTALFLMAVVPTAWYAYAAIAQYHALPSVLSFDSSWEKSIYRAPWRMQFALVSPPVDWPQSGGNAALLGYDEKRTAGFEIAPYPDWRGYSSVSFLASSRTGRPARLSIIVRDRDFNRIERVQFEGSFLVGSSPQRISIPVAEIERGTGSRRLDMSAITALAVVLVDPDEGGSVLVDDFRLE